MDSTTATTPAATEQKFVRGLGLLDSTMLVAGSMIGSGIFIVSSIIARQVGAPGWLLVVWIVTGVLTLMAALSYGELAAMMPKAGGQYVYLREAFSPLWGFLYGWTLFTVIQTGTIAAVAIAEEEVAGFVEGGAPQHQTSAIYPVNRAIRKIAVEVRPASSLQATPSHFDSGQLEGLDRVGRGFLQPPEDRPAQSRRDRRRFRSGGERRARGRARGRAAGRRRPASPPRGR